VTESTLEVSSPEDVLALFGTRDQHLRALRSHFDVSITHRDGRIRVAGEHEDVRSATRALKAMRAIIRHAGILMPEDVDSVLAEQIAERNALKHSPGKVDSANHGGPTLAESTLGDRREGENGRNRESHRDIHRENGSQPDSVRHRSFGSAVAAATTGGIDIHQAGRRIKPRTEGQAGYVEAIRSHDLTFCAGPAGSGKTYLAVACAVEALKENQVRKIVLVRPAVEAGENLGFLPGDLRAKLNPYLRPLLDAINEMVDYDQARSLMEQDIVEVIPLAYMRGRTLSDSFVILDEAQNTTVAQMKMFLTRMGERSRMVVSGDTSQVDLPRGVQSGLRDAIMRLGGIDEIGMVRLQKTDIVRHRLVQRIVHAYEEQEG
jgi:phosphate starvation-inducible PhoH-like protein